jgi:hypothetical protein
VGRMQPRYFYSEGEAGMEETHEEGREVPYPRYLYNDTGTDAPSVFM